MAYLRACLIPLLFLSPSSVLAGGFALRFGPPAIGSGGPNPVSIPPDVRDMGLSFVTEKGVEYNMAATGLSIAARDKSKWGGYTSLGAGLSWSANGGGIGPYAAFGLERGCGGWIGCFSAEFSQSLGFGFGHIASPTALRLGIIKWF
jgi:hypothetical protein